MAKKKRQRNVPQVCLYLREVLGISWLCCACSSCMFHPYKIIFAAFYQCSQQLKGLTDVGVNELRVVCV